VEASRERESSEKPRGHGSCACSTSTGITELEPCWDRALGFASIRFLEREASCDATGMRAALALSPEILVVPVDQPAKVGTE
jgi:hypothetical protein